MFDSTWNVRSYFKLEISIQRENFSGGGINFITLGDWVTYEFLKIAYLPFFVYTCRMKFSFEWNGE